ncbi:tripartite tricarboxylate transporter substrate binding protein [Ramlibacter sp. XY19]|uniref:Bug family tripartite tricarboxylate transporter substrate binding protein n=1 Tax=Ramlibacter paludis TaxID=2908000 RepID=UPI0023DBE719|nr:tripartite tricarboxylate transporter substrate binding protein [Ramlibacter paludis]MCG2594418.1 tripartite tricarboxylate transporter substrate binding protein [Ramlibacter paludis]
MNSSRRRLLLAAGAFGLCAAPAFAQGTYPSKPVKITVAFAPGGGSDLIARLLASKLGDKLGQPVIVENRPGAGGMLGADAVLKQPADGYNLLLAAASYTVNPSVYKQPFDAIKDMTPIAQLARGPFVVAVNPNVPVKTVQELVEFAKKNPGKLSYASAGSGSIVHMVTEYFLDVTGAQITHIPYKGTSPALTDTVGGQTQLIFGTVGSTLPFVKAGKLRAIAVTTPARLPALPDVPTVAESGYPAYQVTNWHGIIAPKGLPRDIQLKLNKAIQEAMFDPKMETTLGDDGLVPAKGTPEDFGTLMASEVARWGAVAKKRNVRAD